MATTRLLTASEVAHRLGVKPATVYAYVSRGLLTRHEASSHRSSLFAPDAVERLADRARHQNRSGALEVVVETELTALDPAGHLYFRGRDAVELARFRSFEAVTGLLWDGDPYAPWELDPATLELVAAMRTLLPSRPTSGEQIPLTVALLGANDPRRSDRRPEAVRRSGARILAGVLEMLCGGAEPADRSAASRLWRAFDPLRRRPQPAQLAAVNAALVLLVDHELAASTLAARVAASTWADPYRVTLAGLGPLGGPLHGQASLEVEQLLSGIEASRDAFTALDRAASAGTLPGFGHRVYRDRDPRADHLLERLPSVASEQSELQRLEIVQALLQAAESLSLPPPNVDFGLAATTHVLRLRQASAATLFTFARIPGLLAHAIEEYPHRLRFRPRASYVGEAPR